MMGVGRLRRVAGAIPYTRPARPLMEVLSHRLFPAATAELSSVRSLHLHLVRSRRSNRCL
jgi:hypothetical protein